MVRKYIYHLGRWSVTQPQLTYIHYLPKAHFHRFLGHHSDEKVSTSQHVLLDAPKKLHKKWLKVTPTRKI